MTYILLIGASLMALFGIVRPAGYIKAPTLMAAVFAAWFSPQLLTVSTNPFVPQDAVYSVGLLALFCLLAVYFGWTYGLSRKTPAKWRVETDILSSKKLLIAVVILTIFTTALNIYLNVLRSTDAGQAQQWTGPITIVAFFSDLRTIPLVLSLLMVLQKRTPIIITIAAINLAISLPVAFLYLRRSELAEIGIVTLGVLWFARRYKVRLPIVFSGLALFSVVVFGIGPLRTAQDEHELRTGEKISILNPEIWSGFEPGQVVSDNINYAPDVRNAIYSTKYIIDGGDFAYGSVVWNRLISLYIPAQILGESFKSGLLIDSGRLQTGELRNRYSFRYQTGTTSTGIGTAYRDFGYFGFIYFMIVGYIMARLYRGAMIGNLWMQTGYLSLLPFCLIMITHDHSLFFVQVPIFYFVIVALRFFVGRGLAGGRVSKRQFVAVGDHNSQASRRASKDTET